MIDRATRTAAGVERISPSVDISGVLVFDARLDAVLADFDDPTVLMTIIVEVSRDNGVTWPEVTTANIVGGSRTKGGLMPFVGVANFEKGENVPFPTGCQARVRIIQNMNIRTGIISETT